MQNTKHKTKNTQSVKAAFTGCYWTNQDRVEFDDGAEGVFGVGWIGLILAVEFEDQTLVLFLQQNQDVLQEDCVQL